MNQKIKILFLASNPKDSNTPLRLDEEIRQIRDKIRAAEFSDTFDLQSRWAVRPRDLLQTFNEVQPHIVHFSGHGSTHSELILEDESGNAKPVSVDAITSLFGVLKDNIRLVILNACHSELQARAVSSVIDCTIGMNDAIGDEAAIAFASTFYGALAFGRSVGHAFDQARVGLMLEGIAEEKTPILLARQGIDVLDVSFVTRAPVNPILPAMSWEILLSAVERNVAINLVQYDGGLAVLAGEKNFDCKFDLEQAAAIEHALTSLIQVGWVKRSSKSVFNVTHAGYAAARQIAPAPDRRLATILKDMSSLILEMKTDLSTESGKHVREFFVLQRGNVLGGSSKQRFVYYQDDHENLRGMLDVLENQRLIIDVTPGNTPIYRMTEDLVNLIREFEA